MPIYTKMSGIVHRLDTTKVVEVFNIYYPVGTYYFTSSTTFNPNVEFGGTWNKTDGAGRCLVGQSTSGAFVTLNANVGAETVTLALTQIPSHTHGGSGAHTHSIAIGHTHTGVAHTHTLNAHTHTIPNHTHASGGGHNHGVTITHNHGGGNNHSHYYIKTIDRGYTSPAGQNAYVDGNGATWEAGDYTYGMPDLSSTGVTSYFNEGGSGTSGGASITTADLASITMTSSGGITSGNSGVVATNSAGSASTSQGGGGSHSNIMPSKVCIIWHRTA